MAIGVLALQGSYHEHILALRRLGVQAVEVRKPEQLAALAGLIIPGGESTTMAKLAEQYNLFPALREFKDTGRPVWGTCAGLIFLADRAVGQKQGGQALLGGLDCTVHRNFFGSQVNSFETQLSVPILADSEGGPPICRGVFIRAPAIVECGSDVKEIAVCDVPSFSSQEGNPLMREKVVVAVKQGNLLATAFHPELTSDTRWHSYFLKLVDKWNSDSVAIVPQKPKIVETVSQLKDLPIFEGTRHLSFQLQ